MSPDAAVAAVARVKGALDYSDFGRADMVIEAVIEDIGLKQRIFAGEGLSTYMCNCLAGDLYTIEFDVTFVNPRF